MYTKGGKAKAKTGKIVCECRGVGGGEGNPRACASDIISLFPFPAYALFGLQIHQVSFDTIYICMYIVHMFVCVWRE